MGFCVVEENCNPFDYKQSNTKLNHENSNEATIQLSCPLFAMILKAQNPPFETIPKYMLWPIINN